MPALERLMLLNDSAMLGKTGIGSYGEVLQLLRAYKAESSEPVWEVMSLILGECKRFIDLDDALEQKIKNLTGDLVAEEYKRLGWEERDGESAADRKLRGTIIAQSIYADRATALKKAEELFDAYKRDNTVIPGELRAIVFSAAAKQGTPGAVDFLVELHDKTPNAELKRDIAASLSSTRDTDVAKRLLTRLKDPDIIKPQDADHWIFMLQRNRYIRDIAWQWMEDNWSWIEKTYADDKSYDYFPRYCAAICNTPEWQLRFASFFESKKDEVVLRRNIEIGLEEITGRLQWLERDLAAVQRFFAGL
jgi:aminopeptidase N